MEEIQESQKNNLQIKILQEPSVFFPEDDDIFYPDGDGKPMAESDFQRDPLIYCVDALRAYFEAEPEVYVSGDLLIYYERYRPGIPAKSVAPDVFVVFGIPKHDRRSYKLWEEGKSPDVAIEIASESNWKKDIENIELYRRLGVGEYFLYDPTGDCFDPVLQGYRLDKKGFYRRIRLGKLPGGVRKLESRFLGLELHLESGRLRIYDPVKREYLLTYSEEKAGRVQERSDRLLAEARTEQEKKRAEQAEEQARKNTAGNLLAMGVLTIEQIAVATGLSEQEIQDLEKSRKNR
ncbi:MAG: Uma2 family endonuclease [Desulfobacteraceae bacterium]|nr:Uma2 family endonuclease [Desulfobacteraceae bacterium]